MNVGKPFVVVFPALFGKFFEKTTIGHGQNFLSFCPSLLDYAKYIKSPGLNDGFTIRTHTDPFHCIFCR